MKTIIIEKNDQAIDIAARVLKEGGVIAFKVDTIYGLSCDATSNTAVKKIYEVKNRKQSMPLITLISDSFPYQNYAKAIQENVTNKLNSIWPAPLTVILEKNDNNYFADLLYYENTFSIRKPSDEFTNILLDKLPFPITSTSANVSGLEVCGDLQSLIRIFDGKIGLIIDCGKATTTAPSTIIKFTESGLSVIREGAISSVSIKALFCS